MRLSEQEYNALIAGRRDKAIERAEQAFTPETKPKGVKRVIRQSSREPNKTERRFEQEYLKPWQASQEIEDYDYEAITLKIANGCRYTPDWTVTAIRSRMGIAAQKTVFYEIKARNMIWDDAIVKLKVAASKYPQFEFYLCAYDGKRGWTIERVLA